MCFLRWKCKQNFKDHEPKWFFYVWQFDCNMQVAWPKKSQNRDCTSYCCFNDLEGGSNGRDVPSLESRRDIFSLCFLLSHLENNKYIKNKKVCLLAFFHTLCLAFEDSAGLESCLKQCLFPAPFPHGIAWVCALSFRGEKKIFVWAIGGCWITVCWPAAGVPQAVGKLYPVTVIQALAIAERVCCW